MNTTSLHASNLQSLLGMSDKISASDTMSPALRKLVTVLFQIPEDSSEEQMFRAGLQFIKDIREILSPAEVADLDSRLLALSSELSMSPDDRTVAEQLGLSRAQWGEHEATTLKALSAEAALTREEKAVARQLGIDPADW